MELSAWQLWIFAGLALCVLEIKLPGFIVFWLGVAALLAAIPAAIGLPLPVQLATFTVASLTLFLASRPLYRQLLMRDATKVRTGVEAMVGGEVTVVEALPEGGSGTVRINGELWLARSLTGPLGEGERAVVDSVDGLKLYVRKPGILVPHSRKEGVLK